MFQVIVNLCTERWIAQDFSLFVRFKNLIFKIMINTT